MLHHLRNPRLLTTYLVGFNVLFSLVGVFQLHHLLSRRAALFVVYRKKC